MRVDVRLELELGLGVPLELPVKVSDRVCEAVRVMDWLIVLDCDRVPLTLDD